MKIFEEQIEKMYDLVPEIPLSIRAGFDQNPQELERAHATENLEDKLTIEIVLGSRRSREKNTFD
jgi:hypothetical protein